MAIIYKCILRLFKNLIWLSKNDIKIEEKFTEKDIKKIAIEALEDDFRKITLKVLEDPHVTISSDE